MEVVRGQRQYKGRASAGSGQSEGRAIEWRPKKRGQGQYRGRDPTPSFAAAREPYPSRGREDCYNVVTRAPTVGNDSVVPDSKRERGVHARYALLGTRSAGGGRRPGDRLGAVPIGPPLALAASHGPGLACPAEDSPARKWRAMGRIEHTLFDRGRSSTPSDLRPSPATPPYHTK